MYYVEYVWGILRHLQNIFATNIQKNTFEIYLGNIFGVIDHSRNSQTKRYVGIIFECDLNIFEEFGPSAEYTHLPKKIHHI